MLNIKLLNASFVQIDCDEDSTIVDLYESYKFKKPNYALNKFSKWDGTIRLFNKHTKQLPFGLLGNLYSLCEKRGYQLNLAPEFKLLKNDISKAYTQELIDDLKLPVTPHPHQKEMFHYLIKNSRVVAKSCTSSGKSLVVYMLMRYYKSLFDSGKTLIIVPSIMLVNQLSQDFKDYSSNNGFNVLDNVHLMCEGATPITSKPVIIATWQSLALLKNDEYFQDFNAVIVDECHLASGDSITSVLNKCTNAYIRFGLTGTLKTDKLHPLQVSAGIGSIKEFIKARELIDNGMATDIKVNIIKLNYDKQTRFNASQVIRNYRDEVQFLIDNQARNNIIIEAAKNLQGNSLFLFDRIDKHLMKIKETLDLTLPNKTVFVITGKVDTKQRDDIKAEIEKGNDIVLLASYGTVSTGVSIKKLHNLVFCHPTKSIVRTLQSIGRMLRMHETKQVANVYDIIDDLRIGDFINRTFEHGLSRKQYYDDEGHPYSIKQVTV